jgi:hypothetical protein
MIASRTGFAPLNGFALFFILVTASLACIDAQENPVVRLTDYVRTYADAPHHTLEIVSGDELFAVVDEGKYPLRARGVDQFTTRSGQSFPSRAMKKDP